MKDALGHGSNPQGLMVAHQTGVRKAIGFKVEKHLAFSGRTAAGQIKWIRISSDRNIPTHTAVSAKKKY